MHVIPRLVLPVTVILTLGGCTAKKQAPMPQARSSAATAADQGRVMIRSGSLDLRVKDVNIAKSRIEEIATKASGRVEDWSTRDDAWLRMKLRVPEPELDDVMDEIATLGKVIGRSQKSRDVTEEMIDLEARVKNLRALRDRLREYLDRAANLEEMLAVERELSRVQTELESIEARLKILKDQVALSELDVQVSKGRWAR